LRVIIEQQLSAILGATMTALGKKTAGNRSLQAGAAVASAEITGGDCYRKPERSLMRVCRLPLLESI